MQRRTLTVAVSTLVITALGAASPVPVGAGEESVGPKPVLHAGSGARWVVEDELVVVFEDAIGPGEARALHRGVGTSLLSRSRRSRIDVVRVPADTSIDGAIARYERRPEIRSVEQNRVVVPLDVPTDPMFEDQWALHNTGQSHPITDYGLSPADSSSGRPDADVDAVEAWDTTTGGTGPVIAVIDTGVDIDHPDLLNSLWINDAERSGVDGIDDDGNGYLDDIHGWDFMNDDANPSPPNTLDGSHGTHVAGIAAAARNDGVGISGVCPGCRIMALRFDFTTATELDAIAYAITNGADVINMSYGGPVWSNAEREAIRRAGDAGILSVVAAGNSSLDNDIPFYQDFSSSPLFPASFTLPTILSVAASTHRDQYGWSSQCQAADIPRWRCAATSWGHDSVDVAAPGIDISSSVVAGEGRGGTPDHDVWDGTSMAAPLVAGIAGLVLDQNPSYTPLQVKNAIMNSVDHPASLDLYTAWGRVTGVGTRALSGRFTRTQGRVNALTALTGSVVDATPSTDGNVDGAVAITRSARGRVSWPTDVNDVYRKRLRRGHRYRVVLDGPRGTDIDLWVFAPGSKEIWQFTPGCFVQDRACPALRAASVSPDAHERVVFRADRTGAHFLVANGFYAAGRYRLAIREI